MSKIEEKSSPLTYDVAANAVKCLFPTQPWKDDTAPEVDEDDISEVTVEEVGEATEELATGKASGSDGVSSEMVWMLIKGRPKILQKLANDILRQRIFRTYGRK